MNNPSPIDRFIALAQNRKEVYKQIVNMLDGKKVRIFITICEDENFLHSHPQFSPFVHDGEFLCDIEPADIFISDCEEEIKYQGGFDDYSTTIMAVEDISEYSEISLTIFGETREAQEKTINALYDKWLSIAEQHDIAYNKYGEAVDHYNERCRVLRELEGELYAN